MAKLRQRPIAQKVVDSTSDAPISRQTSIPIIATARTGLAGEANALQRRLPSSYKNSTVRELLGYMVDTDIKDSEADTVKSLKNELGSAGSVLTINGKNAKLTDKVSNYLIDKEHVVDGRIIQYQQLEVEVTAVQQGGLYRTSF